MVLSSIAFVAVVPFSQGALISRELEGRHWIDGGSENMAVLERGFKRLSEVEPGHLRSEVVSYLTTYVDKNGVQHELVTSSIKYRRAVDIVVLNALLLDPATPIDHWARYGFAREFVSGNPWKSRLGTWRLSPPGSGAFDIQERLQVSDVLNTFDVALRVDTSFQEDKDRIKELLLAKRIDGRMGRASISLVDSDEVLEKSAGLRLKVRLTNESDADLLMPVDLQPGVTVSVKVDERLTLSNTISESGFHAQALRKVESGQSLTYVVPFEQKVLLNDAVPDTYSVEITISTDREETWWRPEPYVLFRRFEATMSARIVISDSGSRYRIVQIPREFELGSQISKQWQ